MSITLTRPDGVHVLASANMQQLTEDNTLQLFGEGLLVQAVAESNLSTTASWSLSQALHHVDSAAVHALLTALLVFDAEVSAVVADKTRTFPLAAFLSYRPNLPELDYPLNMVRLPPLNPDGHYRLSEIAPGQFLVVRLDIHPTLRVCGHVRLALSHAQGLPYRLLNIEHRLERQELNEDLIEAALTVETAQPLSELERTSLAQILRSLL